MSDYTLCDLHVHSEYSHDSMSSMLDIRNTCRQQDLMIAITDHNRIGGSLAARKLGVSVIPAIEVTTRKLKDFLVYFYDHDNLQDFYQKFVQSKIDPGVIFGSRTLLSEAELLDAVEEYDSFVSLAHPYCPIPKRSAKLSTHLLRRVDGIEVMNFAMSKSANAKAAKLQAALGKVHTAGSDAHVVEAVGAVAMRGFGETPAEFLSEVAQGTTMVFGTKRKARDVKDKVMQFAQVKMSN